MPRMMVDVDHPLYVNPAVNDRDAFDEQCRRIIAGLKNNIRPIQELFPSLQRLSDCSEIIDEITVLFKHFHPDNNDSDDACSDDTANTVDFAKIHAFHNVVSSQGAWDILEVALKELFAEKIKMMISAMMLDPAQHELALRVVFAKITPIKKLMKRDVIILELYLQMLSYPDEGEESRQRFNAYLNEFAVRSDVMEYAEQERFQRGLLITSVLTRRVALIKVLHLDHMNRHRGLIYMSDLRIDHFDQHFLDVVRQMPEFVDLLMYAHKNTTDDRCHYLFPSLTSTAVDYIKRCISLYPRAVRGILTLSYPPYPHPDMLSYDYTAVWNAANSPVLFAAFFEVDAYFWRDIYDKLRGTIYRYFLDFMNAQNGESARYFFLQNSEDLEDSFESCLEPFMKGVVVDDEHINLMISLMTSVSKTEDRNELNLPQWQWLVDDDVQYHPKVRVMEAGLKPLYLFMLLGKVDLIKGLLRVGVSSQGKVTIAEKIFESSLSRNSQTDANLHWGPKRTVSLFEFAHLCGAEVVQAFKDFQLEQVIAYIAERDHEAEYKNTVTLFGRQVAHFGCSKQEKVAAAKALRAYLENGPTISGDFKEALSTGNLGRIAAITPVEIRPRISRSISA